MVLRSRIAVLGLSLLVFMAGITGGAQQPRAQAVDENGAPMFKVDPFWPKPLPNRWSMQQVTGISVDHDGPRLVPQSRGRCRGRRDRRRRQPAADRCCVRGPELIELDQEGNVVNAWGGPGYHPKWPTALQTVIADSKGIRLGRRHRRRRTAS